jgi:hypothetical protein
VLMWAKTTVSGFLLQTPGILRQQALPLASWRRFTQTGSESPTIETEQNPTTQCLP